MEGPAVMGGVEQTESDFVLVGIDPRSKQRRLASTFARRGEDLDREGAVAQLRQIREHALANQEALVEQFVQRVSSEEHRRIHSSKDAADAVSYIRKVMGAKRALAVNRASVIDELRPCLESSGYTLIHTYLAEHPREGPGEKALEYYWQLPDIPAETAFESFALLSLPPTGGRKDYTALLGVSAAASEDGSVCFLQHTANIGTMLEEARRLILIVGIEKIVPTRVEAIFQAKSMGAFGLESVVLDLQLPDPSERVVELEDIPWGDHPPETHIIVLDNGRREIARNIEFAQLLTCISCRACAKHCPTHRYFQPGLGSYPKAYLWAHLIGISQSLELCTGCGMCAQQCPLGIEIPRLISLARNQGLVGWHHAVRNRMLYDAWVLMRGAQLFAPAVNALLKIRLARNLIERLTGFQRNAWVPQAHRRTLLQAIRRRIPKEVPS